MSKFILHSAVYSANSVAANTDITENFVPANSTGFTMIAAVINCSAAAVIDINGTDKVMCQPDTSGYTARVNIGTDFLVPFTKLKIETQCNINSCTVYYTVDSIKRKLAAPIAALPAGAYPLPIPVALTAEGGAKIYYTTNGDTPTTDSTIYTGAFNMDTASTVKAIAVMDGCVNSDAASIQYTQAKVVSPVATPEAGAVESGTTVELSTATEGATIYYSVDGSTPSTEYSEPIAITETTTIKAVAKMTGYTDSDTITAEYTVGE